MTSGGSLTCSGPLLSSGETGQLDDSHVAQLGTDVASPGGRPVTAVAGWPQTDGPHGGEKRDLPMEIEGATAGVCAARGRGLAG